ncbi:hypothetical protein L6452_12170 [Arctium lappa]|uniref:Uncharacterized protein n=1 Tax=Arctium lappa TaxID=4217 RepID=A0ACB9DQQ4_ARCLA|nr:hypothetical protein L6452_12170 [Arctium lappa]
MFAILLIQTIAKVVEASSQDYEEGMQACVEASKIWMQPSDLGVHRHTVHKPIKTLIPIASLEIRVFKLVPHVTGKSETETFRRGIAFVATSWPSVLLTHILSFGYF